jgi:hypothetical protein
MPVGRGTQSAIIRDVGVFDPITQPDPERDERLRATAGQVEIRPRSRAAHLATRSLACPECGVPIALAGPVSWNEEIACAFCESIAPTRDYIQPHGWPEVDLIARL